MSQLIERKRVDELVEYLDDLMEHTYAQLVHDMAGRIDVLEAENKRLRAVVKVIADDWKRVDIVAVARAALEAKQEDKA